MDPNRSTGQRWVVVTSSPNSFPGLEGQLADFDVVIRRRPLLAVDLAEDLAGVDRVLTSPAPKQVIVCASPRAASIITSHSVAGVVQEQIAVWCCGEATATALRVAGVEPRVVPGDYADPSTATALVTQLVGTAIGSSVLVVAGEPDLPDVASRLADAGMAVEVVSGYRSQPVSDVELLATLERAEVILVASPLVVRALAAQGDDALLPAWLAVGRPSADACRAAGLPLMAVAEVPTTIAVASALRALLETRFHLQPRIPV